MFRDFLIHLLPRVTLKRNLKMSYTLCLGGLSFTALCVLTLTGILLAMYYSPSAEGAYRSVLYIEEQVFGGLQVRRIHRFSAYAYLVLIFAHTVRVVLTGAFSARSYNWIIGMFIMLISIFTAYLGYLLPMDQLAYWAGVTGLEMIEILPFGSAAAAFLAPDGIGGDLSMVRFYVLHIVLIPFSLIVLIAIHFYRIRKDRGVLPYL